MQASNYRSTNAFVAACDDDKWNIMHSKGDRCALRIAKKRSKGKRKTASRSTVSKSSVTVDEADTMLMHQDLPKLLAIAIQIQDHARMIWDATGMQWTTRQVLQKNSLTVDETLDATWVCHHRLQANPETRGQVRRGEYPITDAIIDDSCKMLRQELLDMRQALQPAPKEAVQATSNDQAEASSTVIRKRKRGGDTKSPPNRRKKQAKLTPPRRDDERDDKHEPELLDEQSPIEQQYIYLDDAPSKHHVHYGIVAPAPIIVDDAVFGDVQAQEAALMEEFSDYYISRGRESMLDALDMGNDLCDFDFGDVPLYAQEEDNIRRRAPSFDIDDIGDEDMETWAKEYGLMDN